jgi:transporter family protein
VSWQIWAVISAIAAGATAVFAKAGLEEVPSHLGNAIRTAIVLALSLAILVVSGEHASLVKLNSKTWWMLSLSALGTAISWVAYFKALSLGSATPVTAIDKSSLVVTMALAVAFFGEAFSVRTTIGVALIVIGAVLAGAK